MIKCSFDCKHKHSFFALECHHHYLNKPMPSFEIIITFRIGSIIKDSFKAEVFTQKHSEVKETIQTDTNGGYNC